VNANALVRSILSSALAALAAGAAPAVAADDEDGAGASYTKDTYPTQSLVRQPLTLPAGMLEIDVPVRFDISAEGTTTGPDWSIPAIVDFGLTDGIQVGIVHATGVCLAGSDNGCENIYDDVGARVRLGLWRSSPAAQLSLDFGVLAQDFEDPLATGFAGLSYKRTLGNLAVAANAQFASALNKRELGVTIAPTPRAILAARSAEGGTEALGANLQAQLQVFTGFAAYAGIGIEAPLREPELTDARTDVPVVLGAEFAPLPAVAVGADVTFPNLVGEDASGDARALSVYARLFL
jgi:hypothetical protein